MTVQIPIAASKAARAILGWNAKDLCRAAGVSPHTVGRLESGGEISTEQNERIAQAFAAHGIELLGDGKPGARLVRQKT